MANPSGRVPSVREIGQGSHRGREVPFIVALEGPPLAGKSTLASRLAAAGPETLLFPDYYNEVPTDRRPGFDPGSTAAQVRAIREFLAVETERLELLRRSSTEICILDRSVESLRAHARALDMIQGYSSRSALEVELRSTAHLVPDVIVYLDAPAQILEQRLNSRRNSQELRQYLDPRYISCIKQHFFSLAETRRGTHMLNIGEYFDRIPTVISSLLPERCMNN